MSCAICPSKICNHGFKIETINMIGYLFFHAHMASLGDLVHVWSRCGHEFNGVRGLYVGNVTWRHIEHLPMIIIMDYRNLDRRTRGSDDGEKAIRPMNQKSL